MSVRFVRNNFKIRSDVKIHDRNTSTAPGIIREISKKSNSPDGFKDANHLYGDFIAQINPEGDLNSDFLFDDFLAAAKLSGQPAVSNPEFKPFLAIVNIPEITQIETPASNDPTPEFNRKIREIVLSLGVFKLYNYIGQFAVPAYGEPVQVTFGDMDTFSDPIFIAPMITGHPPLYDMIGSKNKDDECNKKKKLRTRRGRPSAPAPASFATLPPAGRKFIKSADEGNITGATSGFGTANGGSSYADIKYTIFVPKNYDNSSPANVLIWFHGDSGDGSEATMKKMINKGYIPDGMNIVVIMPRISKLSNKNPSASSKHTIANGFVEDVLNTQVGNPAVKSVVTMSFSGGGNPMSRYLYNLAKDGLFESRISAVRFLDSDYGWVYLTKLFKEYAPTGSKFCFFVALKNSGNREPKNYARVPDVTPAGSKERYESIYLKGARVLKFNTDHYGPFMLVGPEYYMALLKNYAGTIEPPEAKAAAVGTQETEAPVSAPGGQSIDQSEATSVAPTEDLVEQGKPANPITEPTVEVTEEPVFDVSGGVPVATGETVPVATSTEVTTGGGAGTNTEPTGPTEAQKKEGDKKTAKEKSQPTKPTTEKERTSGPSVNKSATRKKDPCDDETNSKEWVKITSYPRAIQSKNTTHRYGLKKMKKWLQGLRNIPGGEDINNARGRGRYENPTRTKSMINKKKYKHFKYYYERFTGPNAAVEGGVSGKFPTVSEPGWYFEDIARRYGGDTTGHVSHESGIDIDMAYPTLYKDPATGKILRGMGIRQKFSRKKKTPDGKKKLIEGVDRFGFIEVYPDDVDYESLAQFMLYTIPQADSINIGFEIRQILLEKIKEYAKGNKFGWSQGHPAYKRLFLSNGKWNESFFESNPAPKKDSHRHHLHIRLKGIAEVPLSGRTNNYLEGRYIKKKIDGKRVEVPLWRDGATPEAGGMDRYAVSGEKTEGPLTTEDTRGGRQGDGRIDPGQPGYSGKARGVQ